MKAYHSYEAHILRGDGETRGPFLYFGFSGVDRRAAEAKRRAESWAAGRTIDPAARVVVRYMGGRID